MIRILAEAGYEATDKWTSHAKYVVIPNSEYSSSKVVKARKMDIPLVTKDKLFSTLNI